MNGLGLFSLNGKKSWARNQNGSHNVGSTIKTFLKHTQERIANQRAYCDEQNSTETLGDEKKDQDIGKDTPKDSADAENQISDKGTADAKTPTTDSKKDAVDNGNPITPVPNADKECNASPPKAKAGNKTIKRKLKVLDATTTDDDAQPKKKNKLGGGIKTL